MATYLITGANRGIGLEMTQQLAACGHRVIATCRNPMTADALSSTQGQVDLQTLDVTDESAVAALANLLNGQVIDVLVNNAGTMAERQSVDDMNYEQWMASFAVNAIAPWRIALAFASHLSASPRPRLITLTSQMGSIARAGCDRVAYRSSKAAANMAMRTLALEWQARGITVCMLHPGWVRTQMGGGDATLSTTESASAILQTIDAITPADTGRFLNYDGSEIPW